MNLLNLDDIAAIVKEPRSYVRTTLVRRPDFPRPALVLSQKIRKWAQSDVEAWLEMQRKKWAR